MKMHEIRTLISGHRYAKVKHLLKKKIANVLANNAIKILSLFGLVATTFYFHFIPSVCVMPSLMSHQNYITDVDVVSVA